jgi:hypothetical protein
MLKYSLKPKWGRHLRCVFAPFGATGAGAYKRPFTPGSPEGTPLVLNPLVEPENRVFLCIYLLYPCKYLMNHLLNLIDTLSIPYY